ncbi:A disintegrin and metalloproteinase with thrombospondin motifs 2 [Aethina tumida]|uniref:A disintegrin and metalloproteinase with thrombospondin motifs 2 n=1 Tax=Aethina tumida TaxID=116153 RepID=UPI0021476FAB|nr:A disintegrin and metalloproteinase with thrombospondin motifs 2 [Aethina tumida]
MCIYVFALCVTLGVALCDPKVFYPEIIRHRARRSVDGDLMEIRVMDWTLELNERDNLMVDKTIVEWVSENGTRVETLRADCEFKQGRVRGLESRSTVVATVCDGRVYGYLNVDGLGHFVEPSDEISKAHLLYSRESERQKRSITGPHFLYNLTGDTIEIGNEANVENEEIADNEPEFQIDKPRNNSIKSIPEWNLYQIEDEELGYFVDTAWSSYNVEHAISVGSNLEERWLEIAMAVDYSVIGFHGKSKVEQYVLALMNIVSAIYQDPSLEANLKLSITRLIFFEHKSQSTLRRGHAKRSLENVNLWNSRLHASLKPGDAVHDIAVWLTRLDIGGPSGFAPVAGVCDPKRSCSLNRDEGLSSAFIVAHEMAHILGLSHDGDKKHKNNCGPLSQEGSVMAPVVSATFNKFVWSDCSKREYKKLYQKWTCLSNRPQGGEGIKLNATLHNFFSMDEQCRMEFGDGYKMCRAFDIVEPCYHLWCGHSKSPLVCKTKKGPPLEGTECGFGKWCVKGFCQEIQGDWSSKTPIMLNPQDGGWSDWSAWGTCSRSCNSGVQFRSRKCDNPEPSYGGKACEGANEEWRVCNTGDCPAPLQDFRAQQCKMLPRLYNFQLDRAKFTWLPYEIDDPDSKCKLSCMSLETKEIYLTEEPLTDGTRCSYDDPDNICVQGKCEKIDCDGKIRSGKRRDLCGVCGGNNSECRSFTVASERSLKREINRLTVLPYLSRGIKIDANFTSPNTNDPTVAFIIKNRRKKKFRVTIPNLSVHTEIVEGTKFDYRKRINRHTIRARGPVLAEMMLLLYSPLSTVNAGLNVSLSVEYTIHKGDLKPSSRFSWILGGWGPCSASCGGGKRQKTAACWDNSGRKVVRRKFCSLLDKPALDTQSCNTFECNFQWIAGEWEPCSKTCGLHGVQFRELYCVPNHVLNVILFKHNGTVMKDPWKHMVNPAKCPDTKPISMRSCNQFPCEIDWSFGEWSQCSTSCGRGLSTRSAFCPSPEDNEIFTCNDKPQTQFRNCRGNLTKTPFCHNRRKHCDKDQSQYCNLDLFTKYCSLRDFRKICCKSCSSILTVQTII